jgi:hypothetical protein
MRNTGLEQPMSVALLLQRSLEFIVEGPATIVERARVRVLGRMRLATMLDKPGRRRLS